MTYTVTLTIGHNVAGAPTFSTDETIELTAQYLELEAFTAFETVGYWQGMRETSTRIEVCAIDEAEVERIQDAIPTLAAAMGQECIMFEARPDRVQFIERYTIAAAIA